MLAWFELQARKGRDAPGTLLRKQPRPLPAYLKWQLAQRAKKEAEAAAGSVAAGQRDPTRDPSSGTRQPVATAKQRAAPSPEATPAPAPPPAAGVALKQLLGRQLLLYRKPPQHAWHGATVIRVAGSSVKLEFTGGAAAALWVDLREQRYYLIPQRPPQPPPAAWQDVVGRRALVSSPAEDGACAFYEGEFTYYQGDRRLPGDGEYIVSYAATETEEAKEEEVVLGKVTHYFIDEEESGGSGGGPAGATPGLIADSLPLGKENGGWASDAPGVKRTEAAAFGSQDSDEAIDIMG